MGKLIVIVGPSGVGKTSLARALTRAYPFQTAYEEHLERPFQSLFKQDKRYALANQIDYLLYRAEQERVLRSSSKIGLVDGGLDLDFHGFTRLFHARGLLTGAEFDLCHRFYSWTRRLLPPPDLIIALSASDEAIRERLASRDRINIATEEDVGLMSRSIEEWLARVPEEGVFRLDVSSEGIDYRESVSLILERVHNLTKQ